jgi:hypothetical protein
MVWKNIRAGTASADDHGHSLAGQSVVALLGGEREISETQFFNYYRCPYDGTEWADVWSCCCNDMCPKCGTKDIEPYKSEDVVHTALTREQAIRAEGQRKARS